MTVWGPEDATFFHPNPNFRGDVLDIFVTHGQDIHLEMKKVHALASDHFPVLALLHPDMLQPLQIQKTDWIKYSWLAQSIPSPEVPLRQEEIEEQASNITSLTSEALNSSRYTCAPNLKNPLGLSRLRKTW